MTGGNPPPPSSRRCGIMEIACGEMRAHFHNPNVCARRSGRAMKRQGGLSSGRCLVGPDQRPEVSAAQQFKTLLASLNRLMFSKIIRRSHMYLALFLMPWVLMYALSTMAM